LKRQKKLHVNEEPFKLVVNSSTIPLFVAKIRTDPSTHAFGRIRRS